MPANNIRFIKSSDIETEWEKCDMWVTDNKKIIDLKPEGKILLNFRQPTINSLQMKKK